MDDDGEEQWGSRGPKAELRFIGAAARNILYTCRVLSFSLFPANNGTGCVLVDLNNSESVMGTHG